MILTNADKISGTWQKLKLHYTERLDALRIQNDGMMEELQRAQQIGRIQEVKAFLALDEELPLVETSLIE